MSDGSVHDVLWTAGWDSTFRVADLVLHHGRTVRPFYVAHPSRPSTGRELASLRRIRDEIVARDPSAASRLLPLEVARWRDLAPDPDVTAKVTELQGRGPLGEQYDWLARFATQRGLRGLELCIHADDKAHAFLTGEVVRSGDEPPDDSWALPAVPADAALTVFTRYRFPVLETTKVEMGEIATARGFGEVLGMTWFCHVPTLRGRPCGVCAPCQYTRDEGLGRRVPAPGLAGRPRYRLRRKAVEVASRHRLLRR